MLLETMLSTAICCFSEILTAGVPCSTLREFQCSSRGQNALAIYKQECSTGRPGDPWNLSRELSLLLLYAQYLLALPDRVNLASSVQTDLEFDYVWLSDS